MILCSWMMWCLWVRLISSPIAWQWTRKLSRLCCSGSCLETHWPERNPALIMSPFGRPSTPDFHFFQGVSSGFLFPLEANVIWKSPKFLMFSGVLFSPSVHFWYPLNKSKQREWCHHTPLLFPHRKITWASKLIRCISLGAIANNRYGKGSVFFSFPGLQKLKILFSEQSWFLQMIFLS